MNIRKERPYKDMTAQKQIELLRELRFQAIEERDYLTADVIEDVLDQEETPYDYLKEVYEHGCASGTVASLVYYDDTEKFYEKHKYAINDLLHDLDINNPAEMFAEQWDNGDPLAFENHNQNLLAWFGYEETAYRLLNTLENAD